MTTANAHTHTHTYKVQYTQNEKADSDEGLQIYFYMERNEIQVNTAGQKMQAAISLCVYTRVHTHLTNMMMGYVSGNQWETRVRGE